MGEALILLAVGLLAFANGANDNFKGVATIYGSGAAGYRAALGWATVATLAGSLLALAIASRLVEAFSGKGLVADSLVGSPGFLGAVAVGAAAAVLLATRLGLPVSTTHALVGALVGAGLVAAGGQVHLAELGSSFLLPLALGPVLAMALTGATYPLAHRARRALAIERETCVCVGGEWRPIRPEPGGTATALPVLTLATGTTASCAERYRGAVVGVSAEGAVRAVHLLSSGAVSFARGLNDTPKIVALLIGAGALGASASTGAVATAIAVGGLLGARRVAETMSHRVTALSPGQGLVSNLSAAALVVVASRYGLPVSTTHVTNGGLFAIGALAGTACWRTIGAILAAWLTTLPLAAALGAFAYPLSSALL
jgi:PiT family inorganic phosphate transporter